MGRPRCVFQSQVTDEISQIIQYPIIWLHIDGVLPYREVNNFYIMSPNLNTFMPMYIARILEHFIPFITTLIIMV